MMRHPFDVIVVKLITIGKKAEPECPQRSARADYTGIPPVCAHSSFGLPSGSNGVTLNDLNNTYQKFNVMDADVMTADAWKQRSHHAEDSSFSGCSHKGLLNLMKWFRPDVFIGGFHFMTLDPHGEGRQRLEMAAAVLKTYSTVFYTGHCTGTEQYDFLKSLMGEQLHPLSGSRTAVL